MASTADLPESQAGGKDRLEKDLSPEELKKGRRRQSNGRALIIHSFYGVGPRTPTDLPRWIIRQIRRAHAS